MAATAPTAHGSPTMYTGKPLGSAAVDTLGHMVLKGDLNTVHALSTLQNGMLHNFHLLEWYSTKIESFNHALCAPQLDTACTY